jgi:hypothetical protein
MTSTAKRDPVADHLITLQNAALIWPPSCRACDKAET